MRAPTRVINQRYELGQLLGEGGFGVVYAAYDHARRAHCALKVLAEAAAFEPGLRQRFLREAEIAGSLRHPNIVETVEVGLDRDTGVPFLAMERLDGSDLWQHARAHGALSLTQSACVLQGVGSAITFAHQSRVIHRDLKPPNVFVARVAEGLVVKVLDFGLAKRTQPGVKNSAVIGTPGWMAPEQLGPGEVGPQTDVWAYALLSFFLLAGREYWVNAQGGGVLALNAEIFAPQTREAASARARRFGVSWPLEPSGYDDWFSTALAWSPAERFASMASAAHALFQVLGRAGVSSQLLTLAPLHPATASVALAEAPASTQAQVHAGPESSQRASVSGAAMPGRHDQGAVEDAWVSSAIGELRTRVAAVDHARLRGEVQAHAARFPSLRPAARSRGAATSVPPGSVPSALPPASSSGHVPAGRRVMVYAAGAALPAHSGSHAHGALATQDFVHGRVKVDLANRMLVLSGSAIPAQALANVTLTAERPYAMVSILLALVAAALMAVSLTASPADSAFLVAAGCVFLGALFCAWSFTRVKVQLVSGESFTLPDISTPEVANACLRALATIRGVP